MNDIEDLKDCVPFLKTLTDVDGDFHKIMTLCSWLTNS